MPLHHRHDYAAGFHRGLRTGDITRSKSSPDGRSRPGARCDPAHVRQVLGWWVRLRGFQPLVPHVCLSVSLAEPASSGSTDPARRCRGLLHHPPPYRGRQPSSSYQMPAATGIQQCPFITTWSKNASWRSKSATQTRFGLNQAPCGEVPIQKIAGTFPILCRDRGSMILTAYNTT